MALLLLTGIGRDPRLRGDRAAPRQARPETAFHGGEETSMTSSRSLRTLSLVPVLALAACITRPVEKAPCKEFVVTPVQAPLFLDKDVDLLFMVDNSNSMADKQKLLVKEFPGLIEGLRSSKFGPSGCTTNCRIPNVHIGVVTSDLGAGNYDLPSCETQGGDGGKLIYQPRVNTGCAVPKDKWISYNEGTTNVTGSSSSDPVQQVKDAFSCIARVGDTGCGFEHQLEAAKKALDENVNPGFLRNDPKTNKDALLVTVLITDEDDCSAQNTKLFDPAQTGLTDPLGPLTSFRCFEFGITCDVNSRTTIGTRKNCVPKTGTGAYLYDPQRYIDFFKKVKKGPDGSAAPTRALVAAITGPTDRVEVGVDGSTPTLKASCSSSQGDAAPAIRIKSVIDGLGDQGESHSICAGEFATVFKKLSEEIVASLGALCLKAPALTEENALVCQAGDSISSKDPAKKCAATTLEQAACAVSELSASTGASTDIEQCPTEVFENASSKDCGSTCPCWRLVKSTECKPENGSSPYAIEILRKGEAPKGTYARFSCLSSPYKWGDEASTTSGQCQ
jgi:hypothetical protein